MGVTAAQTRLCCAAVVCCKLIETMASPDSLDTAVASFQSSNSPQVYQLASKTLLTLLSNIIKNPADERFRSIHVTNKAIQQRLLSANGAQSLLLAAGFVEREQTFEFEDMVHLPLLSRVVMMLLAQLPPAEPANTPEPATSEAAAPITATNTSEREAAAAKYLKDVDREISRAADPERISWLKEQKRQKQQDEAEKVVLRAKIAAQRKAQRDE